MDTFVGLVNSGSLEISHLPNDSQISARSKGDSLSKGIAIMQGLWFASNMISRLVSKYDISPLEDLTVAYLFCGLVTFCCLFRCPYDLQDQFIVTMEAKNENVGSTCPKSQRGIVRKKELSKRAVFLICLALFAIFSAIHLGA
jgi:hypothetical protein